MRCFVRGRAVVSLLALLCVLAASSPASAIWVVNFGTAETLPPRRIGFAAGMGGQAVFAGDPAKANANFIIPHAGVRVGVLDRLDFGWRLALVPLPYSTAGPGFGANLDAKLRLTNAGANVAVALVAGAGLAHVRVRDDNEVALSPNGAGLLTFRTTEKTHLTLMARYVYLAIPTAPGSPVQNFVHITGSSVGMKIAPLPHLSVLPEVGTY